MSLAKAGDGPDMVRRWHRGNFGMNLVNLLTNGSGEPAYNESCEPAYI